jgi:hypothetical protein
VADGRDTTPAGVFKSNPTRGALVVPDENDIRADEEVNAALHYEKGDIADARDPNRRGATIS